MCVARLVLQEWSEEFSEILKNCKIAELLKAIYVDDSRGMFSLLRQGERFDPTTRTLTNSEEQRMEDFLLKKSKKKIQRQKLER